MAEIPSWLNYAPLGSNFSGQQMATTLMEQDLATRQLAQQKAIQEAELAMRAQEAAQRMALERQQLAQQASIAQLEAAGQQAQQGLQAQEIANIALNNRLNQAAAQSKESREAQEMAVKFGAYQQFQQDLAGGVEYGEALRKNLAGLTFGTSPGVLAQTIPEQRLETPRLLPSGMPGVNLVETQFGKFTPVEDPGFVSPVKQSQIDVNKARVAELTQRYEGSMTRDQKAIFDAMVKTRMESFGFATLPTEQQDIEIAKLAEKAKQSAPSPGDAPPKLKEYRWTPSEGIQPYQ